MIFKKIYLQKIESTNDYALKYIKSLDDKTIILADIQTKGKGRNSKTWMSYKNNLFTSFVLKPQYDFYKDYTLNALTQYTVLVLSRVLKNKYLIDAKIKWPNDLLVDGKKISGILIETVIQGDFLQGVVVGIGVNSNLDEDSLKSIDQPATSLNLLVGKSINKDEFLNFLLQEFFLQYEELLVQGFVLIKDEYIAKNMFLGKFVKAVVFDKIYNGIAKKINDEGKLVLDCDGKEEVLSIGDIIC